MPTSKQLARLSEDEVRQWIARELRPEDFRHKRVLTIVPDATRTAPLPLLFDAIRATLQPVASQLDVLVALGTHPAMSQEQIGALLGVPSADHANVGCFNHEWNRPERLLPLGRIAGSEISALSGGLLKHEVPVTINAHIRDYDVLLVVGPVFPHEVVGFSGGNKYFFPGISGPELLNAFHWLGALITNVEIIGKLETPVRRVIDRAAAMIPVERKCLAFVVAEDASVYDLFYGTPESAWRRAAELSAEVHVTRVDRPYRQVLSCAPPMYDELWVAGKCMYKLEPVVADGGELIIYAPHMRQISATHGRLIEQVGYHVRDYFTSQWERFQHIPWGVLAHSTHVRGTGSYDGGLEHPRIQVTLASAIPRDVCEKINLGYRDPATIEVESFADQQENGVLLVRKAGERLFRLAQDCAS